MILACPPPNTPSFLWDSCWKQRAHILNSDCALASVSQVSGWQVFPITWARMAFYSLLLIPTVPKLVKNYLTPPPQLPVRMMLEAPCLDPMWKATQRETLQTSFQRDEKSLKTEIRQSVFVWPSAKDELVFHPCGGNDDKSKE